MAAILVIDDEPMVLNLTAIVLRLVGHSVTAMSDPLKAVDSFRTGHPRIDLILVDVSMKPISGFEIVTRLSNMGVEIPVLFMSGYSAFSETIAGLLGKRALIEKPFTADHLRAAVSRILTKSQPIPCDA